MPKVVKIVVQVESHDKAIETFTNALKAGGRHVCIVARESIIPEAVTGAGGKPLGDNTYTVEYYYPLDGEETGTSTARRETSLSAKVVELRSKRQR